MKRVALYCLAGFLGICGGGACVASIVLHRISHEPNTTVEFLPMREWFTNGIAACGPTSTTITDIYGPIAVTRTHHYGRRKTDTAYLEGAPTIGEQAAQEIGRGLWPTNEEQTTDEIYAAAAEIRNRRPRDLVGYVNGEAEIPMGVCFELARPRQRR